MNVEIPSEEEFLKERRYKRRQFVYGILVGFIVFGLIGTKVFIYGFDQVAWYTWLVLGFGVLSFGIMAYKFGSSFWALLKP